MLKIFIDTVNLYGFLKNHKILSKFFVLNVHKIEELADPVLHSLAVSELQTPESPTKQTSPTRFNDMDKELNGFLRTDKHYKIHDMGVSNGITSLELYQYLKLTNTDFRLCISDKYNRVLMFRKGPFQMYLSSDLQLICGDLFGIACMPSISLKYFISNFLGKLTQSFLTKKTLTMAAKESTEINLLFSPVQQLIANGEIECIHCDIFETKFNADFDIVRCMNLLNLVYFPESKIRIALDNITLSLKEGGLLQIGRTLPNGINNVSFFRKERGSLRIVHECNGGSELKSLVLGKSNQRV